MTPLDKILAWHQNWSILNGTVRCKRCGGVQQEVDRSLQFPHSPTCTMFGATIQPWVALDDVKPAVDSLEQFTPVSSGPQAPS